MQAAEEEEEERGRKGRKDKDRRQRGGGGDKASWGDDDFAGRDKARAAEASHGPNPSHWPRTTSRGATRRVRPGGPLPRRR